MACTQFVADANANVSLANVTLLFLQKLIHPYFPKATLLCCDSVGKKICRLEMT
ncbi:hypothetical protein E2C01_059644 [Portunus trituberculatus]|uniref:Uncharacterized protein n=1 Tax=Portunus trituberculatus TaxID=210409 RepID=A0A5B7H6S0_PORTR|nr:hypothetical protein [Portunus trituberculatus]